MIRSLILAGMMVVAGRAQSPGPDPATRALIEKLQARIDSLEKRLADLEQGSPSARAATLAAPAAPVATPATAHSHDAAPVPTSSEQSEAPVYPALKISGFGDLNFAATTSHPATTGFSNQSL